MNAEYYGQIFKRKSFHFFRGVGNEKLTQRELDEIAAAYEGFERLCPEIRTAIRIVPASRFSFKHDAEYCVLIYSEKKDNYLLNAGYIGEQLDLWLVSRGIGSLWFGIGKPDEKQYLGLDYVIMIALRKVSEPSQFRDDMFSAKRKPLAETWSGDTLGAAEIARFAPSACNSQPWYVESSGGTLTVSRRTRPGFMPPATALYFNRIDMGIYLCILEICLAEKGISFSRELFPDSGESGAQSVKNAVYRLAAD